MTTTERFDARLVRLVDAGQTYFPIIYKGAAASLEQIALWAHLADRARDPDRRRVRKAYAILADESPLRGGGPLTPPPGWALELADLTWSPIGVPLTFQGTGLTIAWIEGIEMKPPGSTPGTVGHHVVAELALRDTLLATIAYRAIADGIFQGLCAVITDAQPDAERRVHAGGELVYVQLADSASVCCAAARVLESFEVQYTDAAADQ
jgi:hypothetical protein